MNTNRKGEIEMEKLNYKVDVALFTTTHIKPRRLDIYWIDLGKVMEVFKVGLDLV